MEVKKIRQFSAKLAEILFEIIFIVIFYSDYIRLKYRTHNCTGRYCNPETNIIFIINLIFFICFDIFTLFKYKEDYKIFGKFEKLKKFLEEKQKNDKKLFFLIIFSYIAFVIVLEFFLKDKIEKLMLIIKNKIGF